MSKVIEGDARSTGLESESIDCIITSPPYLNKTDYNGTMEIDYQNPRDDRVKSLKLAVKNIYLFNAMAEKLIEHSAKIENNLKGYRFTDNMDLITDLLFGNFQSGF